jgi:hypothetical protein
MGAICNKSVTFYLLYSSQTLKKLKAGNTKRWKGKENPLPKGRAPTAKNENDLEERSFVDEKPDGNNKRRT